MSRRAEIPVVSAGPSGATMMPARARRHIGSRHPRTQTAMPRTSSGMVVRNSRPPNPELWRGFGSPWRKRKSALKYWK